MSVQRIPVLVMKTLIATRVTVLTAVLANRDSLEMEHFVKVPRVFIDLLTNSCRFTIVLPSTKKNPKKSSFFLMTSDIDECSADSSPCDENADCTNSDGSYRCTCKQGFTGNGAVCEGMIQNSFFYRRDWNGQKIAYDSFPSFRFLFHHSDIDECSADSNPCDENADCTNSDGSYTCNCKQGFKGDGTVCEGKLYYSFIYKSDCNGHNTTYAFFLFPFFIR